MLAVRDLHAFYGKSHILHGVSLRVDEGEIVAPMLVQQVAGLLTEIAQRGVSILLVEQKLTIALTISRRVYVMGRGRVVFEGTPQDLRGTRRSARGGSRCGPEKCRQCLHFSSRGRQRAGEAQAGRWADPSRTRPNRVLPYNPQPHDRSETPGSSVLSSWSSFSFAPIETLLPLGHVASREYSDPPAWASHGDHRRQGGITKAGNIHARRALVEGAWVYRYPAKVSRHLQLRLEKVPAEIQAISWTGAAAPVQDRGGNRTTDPAVT